MSEKLLASIKKIFKDVAPNAKVILFGSHARNDAKEGSDVDLMVILDQKSISWEDENKIFTPLYALEVESGKIISPHIITEEDWAKTAHRSTFYHQVMNEGILL